MAQNQILKSLVQFGLNPSEWNLRKLKSSGAMKIVWLQSHCEDLWVMGYLDQDLQLQDLEFMDIERSSQTGSNSPTADCA